MNDENYSNISDEKEEALQSKSKKESSTETEKDPAEIIQDLELELAGLKDKYLRVHAEMENMKKRTLREHTEVVKFGNTILLKDFLWVYDAIEKSINMAREMYPDDKNFIEGLLMTEKLFLEALKKHNVEPIETKDAAFDPNYHEAMMQIKRDDVENNMVLDEIEKGFMLHERVLRPAKVTVSG